MKILKFGIFLVTAFGFVTMCYQTPQETLRGKIDVIGVYIADSTSFGPSRVFIGVTLKNLTNRLNQVPIVPDTGPAVKLFLGKAEQLIDPSTNSDFVELQPSEEKQIFLKFYIKNVEMSGALAKWDSTKIISNMKIVFIRQADENMDLTITSGDSVQYYLDEKGGQD